MSAVQFKPVPLQVGYPTRRDLWEQTIHAPPRSLFIHLRGHTVRDLRTDGARLPEMGEEAVKFQPLSIYGFSNHTPNGSRANRVEILGIKYVRCVKRYLPKISVARHDRLEYVGNPSGLLLAMKRRVF